MDINFNNKAKFKGKSKKTQPPKDPHEEVEAAAFNNPQIDVDPDDETYVFKPEYQNGAEGCILFAEDHIRIEVAFHGSMSKQWIKLKDLPDDPHPVTGRSYKQMWEEHKKVLREALKMENGQFIYRTIILCWPRGEGKSFVVCLIKTWRFFVFPRQKILCGANSKEQVEFVHYDVIKDMVLHSPELTKLVGIQNIQKSGMTLKDSTGNVQSEIKPISSHTGLLSNINGYTFCDLYKMKNTTFFTELDGSTRWIPNAMGVVDSTVSAPEHILHKLYRAWQEGTDPTLYFSYRYSEEGVSKDYWNPNATDAQLNGFRVKFPFGDFDRFFRNVWDAGKENLFTPIQIEATRYLGVDKQVNVHNTLMEVLTKRGEILREKDRLESHDIPLTNNALKAIDSRLWKFDSVYSLINEHHMEKLPDLESLNKLSDFYDTNWAILAGLDRADPTRDKRTAARTIVTAIAKGLIGSRSNPFGTNIGMSSAGQKKKDEGVVKVQPYIYIVLYLKSIEDHSLEGIKDALGLIEDIFDGIDTFGSERWGAWDLRPWCEDRDVKIDLWQSSYNLQKAIFAELYNAVKFGRFKAPSFSVIGSNGGDIYEEEMSVFNHEPPAENKVSGWFGSPEKNKVDGIQDDTIFTIGNTIYAGRELTPLDFRERKGNIDFGSFFADPSLLGRYK